MMRLMTVIFLSSLCSVAYADQPPPANLQDLPPPVMDNNEPTDEPQVTITTQTEQTVEEFRAAGKLYMIKITPKVGKPYYLVDERGDGKFSRQESLDSGIRPPRWVILKF